jgi:hypothetical protein
MATDFTKIAPIRVNTTVLATMNVNFDPGIEDNAIQHSGRLYSTNRLRGRVTPMLTFQTYARAALDLIGTSTLAITALDWYVRPHTGAVQNATGDRISLNTTGGNATGVAMVTALGLVDGVVMATVQIKLLSANGLAHPLAAPVTGQSLATLASDPARHVLGPLSLNGTAREGTTSFSADFGQNLAALPTDGKTFDDVAIYLGGAPSLSIDHASLRSLVTAAGFGGANISGNVVQYFRPLNADGITVATTGAGSMTIASGRFNITGGNQAVGQTDSATLEVLATNGAGDDVHPFVFAWNASLP